MQKRTSPLKFGDLAEKSGLNSVSDLSTEVPSAREGIEHYGSRKLSAALSKCLEDPACPAPARPQPLLARAAARAFEPEILTV